MAKKIFHAYDWRAKQKNENREKAFPERQSKDPFWIPSWMNEAESKNESDTKIETEIDFELPPGQRRALAQTRAEIQSYHKEREPLHEISVYELALRLDWAQLQDRPQREVGFGGEARSRYVFPSPPFQNSRLTSNNMNEWFG